MNQPTTENDAISEAAMWQAQLSSDLVTDQQHYEFAQWLDQNQKNKIAWKEVNSFWNGLDGLSEADILSGADEPNNSEHLNIEDVLEFDQHETITFQTIDQQISKSSFLPGIGLSKSILGIAASFLLVFTLFYSQVDFWLADYSTAPGELRSIKLSDGSQVMLSTDTFISVDYSEQKRQLTLHQGEAYFDVAADKSRPFIVTTQTGHIRALGTEFDIKSRGDDVQVTVFEHAVKVSLDNGQVFESLPEGQQLVFNDEKIEKPSVANLSRTQSWRNQQIIFQDKPLVDVISELNAYRSGSIFIVSSAIKSLSVTGIFDTQDTDIALKTIEQSLPVDVRTFSDKLVFISAR